LRDPFQRGQEAYQRGHYARAVDAFNRGLAARPGDAAALFARGRAYQQLGNLTQAQKDYEQADRLAPSGQIKACLGYCLSDDNPPPAVAYYAKAIRAAFGTAEVFNTLGHGYFYTTQLDKAQTSLDRAIQLRPDLQAAFHNRALVDLKRAVKDAVHCPTAGLRDVQKALQLGPGTADLYYDAACLCAVAAKCHPELTAQALNYLQSAVEHGQNPQAIANDILFDPLRQDAAFQNLIRRPIPPLPPRGAVRLV